jgi:three-Cys-motif partner protein
MSPKRRTAGRPRVREHLENDGLPIPEIGEWSLQQYEMLGLYCELFSSAMKDKWAERVYIDAFCGPGRARLRGTDNIVETSPFMALRISVPFTKYIFCDEDEAAVRSLDQRVQREFRKERQVVFVPGDVNSCYPEIIKKIPEGPDVLKFCFLDPYDIGVHFTTVRELAKVERVDFLILLALQMDARRNIGCYEDPRSDKIEKFLDMPRWREDWNAFRKKHGQNPVRFLAEKYAARMEGIGYRRLELDKMKQIKASQLGLYYLALFSRAQIAYHFWGQVLKYTDGQISMPFEH